MMISVITQISWLQRRNK